MDGQAFAVDQTGKQAMTNFRASRITPGRHVLEIKGIRASRIGARRSTRSQARR